MKQRIPRRAQRYAVKLEVKTLNGQPLSETSLLDVSSLGARIESNLGLAPMRQVEFTVSFPGADTETKLAGTVVWMRRVLGAPGRSTAKSRRTSSRRTWPRIPSGRSNQCWRSSPR